MVLLFEPEQTLRPPVAQQRLEFTEFAAHGNLRVVALHQRPGRQVRRRVVRRRIDDLKSQVIRLDR